MAKKIEKVDFTPEPEDSDIKSTGPAENIIPARLFHIKVGTKEFPAKEEYIEEVRKEIEEKAKGMNCVFFVTPHDVEIATII